MKLDDRSLTERGLTERRSGSVLILACGALAREIIALRTLNGWSHVDLHCLPAKLHLYPDRIPDEVQKAVERFRSDYHTVFVAYADCGTGGLLETRCQEMDVEMIEGPHCYSFFGGNAAFAEKSAEETTTFYLTDFLVRQFDAFVTRPLGLDRHPELRDDYFRNYESLVYLAQTESPELDRKAENAANKLGLAYSRRFTGYGDLADALAAAVN